MSKVEIHPDDEKCLMKDFFVPFGTGQIRGILTQIALLQGARLPYSHRNQKFNDARHY